MAVFFFIGSLETAGLLEMQQAVVCKIQAKGFIHYLLFAFQVSKKAVGESVVKGTEFH